LFGTTVGEPWELYAKRLRLRFFVDCWIVVVCFLALLLTLAEDEPRATVRCTCGQELEMSESDTWSYSALMFGGIKGMCTSTDERKSGVAKKPDRPAMVDAVSRSSTAMLWGDSGVGAGDG
jgi:hypothetical protein